MFYANLIFIYSLNTFSARKLLNLALNVLTFFYFGYLIILILLSVLNLAKFENSELEILE